MKNKSLILRKATFRHSKKPKQYRINGVKQWDEIKDIGQLHSSDVGRILEVLLSKLGYKVEMSQSGEIRFKEYLTEEHEDILLGDKE